MAASLLVILNGHTQAQHMVQTQPMKMAAAEALWESEDPASFSLFTFGNEPERRDVFAIRIPSVLSLLAYNRLDGEVKGINELQAEYEQSTDRATTCRPWRSPTGPSGQWSAAGS